MRIQLADRSIRLARGIVEDVLIKIENFYFPVDVIVLDTEPVNDPATQIKVILGRPFQATAKAVINCRNGIMKSFGNMSLELNIFHLSRQSTPDDEDLREVNLVDNIVNNLLTLSDIYSFDEYIASFNADFDIDSMISDVNSLLDSVPLMNINDLDPIEPPLIPPLTIDTSCESEPPQLELKTLPDSLEYVFLGSNETPPVIIASDLF